MSDKEMISCEEAVERVYEFLDGELDADMMESIGEHIGVCQRCYPYFNFERIFLDHIRSKGLRTEKSENLEQRIREALRDTD
jgi:anti-sigma factor (TIGR02949 family)